MVFKLKNRNVIRIGRSLLFCLPPEWLVNNELEAKSKLELQVLDNDSLVVKPAKKCSKQN